ncbi:MAG: ABC transporter permease [Actinomycetota bacterium]|nr:ABC transporter permease [Actinomycetota bacterium]
MSLADVAAQNGLARVGARPPLGIYLKDVWKRRQFIYSLAKFRIESENQRNRLGMGWVILRPLINAGVYGLIFGVLLNAKAGIDDFVSFLIIGVFFFEFFSTAFNNGAKAITSNNALVQSLSFPRMALPMSSVTQHFLKFLPTIPIMLILVMVMGTMPHWQWLLLIPLCAIFYVFNAGLALITARLTVHFRDLSQLLPFVTRLIFYTTGIFFSFEQRFGEKHPMVMRIVDFQPIHEFLSLARSIVLKGPEYAVNPEYWLYASVWSLALFAIGVAFFWAAEERYGRTD